MRIAHNGTAALPVGTTFTLISNPTSTPIAGTFAGIPNNATITLGANNYQVMSDGGDGNDLTLTVVP